MRFGQNVFSDRFTSDSLHAFCRWGEPCLPSKRGWGPSDCCSSTSPIRLSSSRRIPGSSASEDAWTASAGTCGSTPEAMALPRVISETDSVAISNADILAVLDAVGFERAALVAEGMPGSLIRFSLDHPERVSSLVLINSAAHFVREDDYPYGVPRELIESMITDHRDNWGDPAVAIQLLAPSRIGEDRFNDWYARTMRFSAGPNLVADMVRVALEEDVRPLLRSISHPTLVLHRQGDLYVEVGAGHTWPSTSTTAIRRPPRRRPPVLRGRHRCLGGRDRGVLTGIRSGAGATR